MGPSRLPGANEGQRLAYSACLSRGVFLVWGPPGTGKTWVLGRAIADLLTDGKRVLLVSATNIAVDNALATVARDRHRWQPGQLVRVGPPALREIAINDDVALSRLVATRCQQVEVARRQVEDELLEFRQAERRLRQADLVLAGYDHDAYLRASALLAAEERIREVEEQLPDLAAETESAARFLEKAGRQVADLEKAWDEMADGRWHLAEASRLDRELDNLELSLGRLQAELLDLDQRRRPTERALERLDSLSIVGRFRSRRERKRLRAERMEAVANLGEVWKQGNDARKLHERQTELLSPRIAEHRQLAHPLSPEEVERTTAALEEARASHVRAKQHLRGCEERTARARQQVMAGKAQGHPSAAQRQMVDEATRERLPQRNAERAELQLVVSRDREKRQNLEARHEELLDELESLRRDAEAQIIGKASLVVTTLARFRLHQAVFCGSYDVVLIDEVSAAAIPEVLLAVSRARTTAVLLGDFLQLGPVLPGKLEKAELPEVQNWLLRDSFGLCGIDSADDAKRHGGCVVLDIQYRFGEEIMELANAAIYRNTLKLGKPSPANPEDPAIVLLDTDDLDDLGMIRRTAATAGWWPVGSLLARILAQHHRSRGESVGIIAPYGKQVEATLEAVRDVEGEEGLYATDVGTVHRFQGREFDVVVFDMVEGGGRTGWVGQGQVSSTSRWQRDGARVFNVALTRARLKVYLIGSGNLIRKARPSTVLGAVNALSATGRIVTVKAATLLGPGGDSSGPEPEPLVEELAAILAQHVRVMNIDDEHTFYATLREYLEGAQESVWMWAAWTTKRLATVLPLLEAARNRGVRLCVFVRSDRDPLMADPLSQRMLRQLLDIVPNTVRYYKMHQKIVIIDERVTLLGSLNVFSHRDTRDVMIAMEGRQFARGLLAHEGGEEFLRSPACLSCSSVSMELCRSEAESKRYGWSAVASASGVPASTAARNAS